jgi:hypothetical protein
MAEGESFSLEPFKQGSGRRGRIFHRFRFDPY